MPAVLIPSRRSVFALAALASSVAAALLIGWPLGRVAALAGAALLMGLAWAGIDYWRSWHAWQRAPLRLERRLPGAFALGVPTALTLTLINEGAAAWQVDVFDEVDPHFAFDGLPQSVTVPAAGRLDIRYTATALQRGLARFGVVQLRLSSRGGCFDIARSLGQPVELRVYPNFAAVAGYAWLAGDQRLAQIGIKTFAQRGLGTDFRQLADYRTGDPVRHIDWKATLRHGKPIVRQYQDERDQCVFFLLDCGRRMRADDARQGVGGSHFDQALDALMLLAYVALKEGDKVGATTFGLPPGQRRDFAPRKGAATINALMNRLHDLQPGPTHSDYLMAAQELMQQQTRRALVIVLTNFRDEDSAELRPALKLMRRKHLVLVASLRERVLGQIANQTLAEAGDVAEVSTAHLFAQSRSDAFARVVGRDALSIDVEPAQLAITLVNRYHAVKRAGLL
jgi:uncharacterized protein (DUF58 family)